MKNSTTDQTNTGHDRASDVPRRPPTWHPSFQQFWAIHRPSLIEPALPVELLGTFPTSNLNLDAWKQSAGVFPVGSILCCARETFKTSIELIDPAQKPIYATDTGHGEIKILDPSSSSPIHLWSKSKI